MNTPDWRSSDFNVVRKAARAIVDLHQKTAIDTELPANRLIDSGSKDIDVIQRLLDQSLDACAHKAAVPAFERLCRYYAEIDIAGARFYSNAYLEMWGDQKANQCGVSDDT